MTTAAGAGAAAQPRAGSLPARERSDLLVAASEAIAASAERLASSLPRRRESGAPKWGRSRSRPSTSAGSPRARVGPLGPVHSHEAPDRRHLTTRRPAGVVASLTPWNFPCSIQARKLAPALAAGCTVVARVSKKAPPTLG
ncbi:MAG: aldehyde dehydrogenase family protein [Marmoricola sp.]